MNLATLRRGFKESGDAISSTMVDCFSKNPSFTVLTMQQNKAVWTVVTLEK